MTTDTAAVSVEHVGGDRLRINIRQHELYADQPLDGGGDDTAPTPTELFLGSLAACVAFYAERYLRRQGVSTEGLSVRCDWTWASDPIRVGTVEIKVDAPTLPPDRQDAFLRIIERCPIDNTLRQPPAVRFTVATPAVRRPLPVFGV